MARVGGRNSWIAVPVGLGCAAIVGALVWLSLPMVPVTVAWAGDMLRNATSPRPQPENRSSYQPYGGGGRATSMPTGPVVRVTRGDKMTEVPVGGK